MAGFSRAGEAGRRGGDAAVQVAAALGYEDSLFESRLPRETCGAAGLQLLSNALEGSLLRDQARSRLLAAVGRAQAYGGQRELGEATCRLAVEAAVRAADDGALAYAQLSLRAAHSGPEHLAARLAGIDALVQAATRAGDVESELEGVRLQLVDLLEAGDTAGAAAAQERAEALIVALRRPLFLWYPPMWRAMAALFTGDLDAAERLIQRFRDDGRRWHYRDVEPVHAVQVAQLHQELGTPGAALPTLRAAAAASPDRFAPILAAWLARAGELDEAAEQLAVHGRHGFTTLPQDLSLAYGLAQAVDASALLGDPAAAAHLRTLLLPWAGHNIVLGSGAVCLGAASHFIGVAAGVGGDVDDAIAHLRDAVRMNDAMSAAPAAARSRLELARALAAAGRDGDARHVIDEELPEADGIGLPGVARAMDDLDRETTSDARS